MRNRLHLLRRGVLALLVVAALTLMHGGVGQAAVCGPSMLPMPMSMPGDVAPMSNSGSDEAHDVHHQPADQPIKAHSKNMCVSAAISVGGDGKNAGSGASQAVVDDVVLPLRDLMSVSDRTSWDPPRPDLISELCVVRQ